MSLRELIELLTELLGPLPGMVLSQIDKFAKQGLTYKEIARACYYMFDVKKMDKHSIHVYGIGLVPKVVDEANQYYNAIKRQQEQQRQQAIAAKDIPNRVVTPQPRVKRKRGIDINEL